MRLEDLAAATGGQLEPAQEDARQAEVKGLCAVQDVQPGYVTYATSKKWLDRAVEANPLAIIVKPGIARPPGPTYILHDDPEGAYGTGLHHLHVSFGLLHRPEPWIAPTAQIDPGADVADSARVCHFVVVEAGTRIGERAEVRAGAKIGRHVVIGSECWIGENAVISDCVMLESGVRILPGAVVGIDGFVYSRDLGGIPRAASHEGATVIRCRAEIGANTVVAKAEGYGRKTEIGRDAKVDSLVQIAHNCEVGAGSRIAAQTGLAGRVQVGEHAVLKGQVGVNPEVRIGDNSVVGGQAGVWEDVPEGRRYTGYPAEPHGKSARLILLLRELRDSRMMPMLRELQKVYGRRELRCLRGYRGDDAEALGEDTS